MSEQIRRLFAFPMFPVASSCQRDLTGRHPQNMLRSSPTGNCWSQLTPLKVDDRGRISNWPLGFMDDDVKESRRLIETMYDSPPEEEPEP